MPDDLSLSIFRARLNYKDIEQYTGWDNLMINDYLGIGQGSLALADQLDQNTANIALNTENIENLDEFTAGLQTKIYSINSRVGENSRNIRDNTESIEQNSLDIAENTLNIEDLFQLVNRV